MTKKTKKIIFGEEIDNKISGLALVLAFLSIGIFLLLFPDYFGNKLVATIIRWAFITIGIIGFVGEFTRTKNDKKSSNIKGFDDFIVGIVLIGVWVVLFIFLNIWWINIISFSISIIGLYGLYQGLLQIIYSTVQNIKNNKETKKSVTTDIMLLLTKVLGLVLVILQIIRALGPQ